MAALGSAYTPDDLLLHLDYRPRLYACILVELIGQRHVSPERSTPSLLHV